MGQPLSAGSRGIRHVLAVAALVVAGGLAVPAQAAPTTSDVPVLGAKNEISGSRTSSLVVRLDRSIAVDPRAFVRSMKVVGGGRVRGIILTPQGDPDGDRVVLSSLLLSFCGKPGCADQDPQISAPNRTARDKAGRSLLPAGKYRLYLIADTKLVRVTFSLPGQRGTLRLQPQQPEAHGALTPTVLRETKAQDNHVSYSSGTSLVTVSPDNFVMYGIRVTRSRTWVQGLFAICLHHGEPPVAALAFQPGCADGDENYGIGDGFINPGVPGVHPAFDRTYLGLSVIAKPGKNAFGGYLTKVGVADDVGGVMFAIDFANARD